MKIPILKKRPASAKKRIPLLHYPCHACIAVLLVFCGFDAPGIEDFAATAPDSIKSAATPVKHALIEAVQAEISDDAEAETSTSSCYTPVSAFNPSSLVFYSLPLTSFTLNPSGFFASHFARPPPAPQTT